MDVERMVAEAKIAGGGVIHFGNPNNPTSSITSKVRVRWLGENLPPNTVALIDEAYIQFADPTLDIRHQSRIYSTLFDHPIPPHGA